MSIVLRPYQKSVLRDVSGHYQSGLLGVLLQMATGAGKTRTAAYMVDKYASTGRQVLWVVHREELLMQAAMVFAEQGVPHTLVCASSSERAIKAQEFREFGRSWVAPGSMVIVASIQTIVRRLDVLPWLQPSQIVADECHLSLSVSWRRVLAHWPEARLLGLSATPVRLDRQSFARPEGGLYDAMVCGPKVSDLIAWGNLARYDAYHPDLELVQGVADLKKLKGGDYDAQELEKELDAPKVYGDVVEHYRTYSHGKPAIAFCPTVASAEKFAEAFRAAGYRAIALDGDTDDSVRRQSLLKLGTGEIDVVTSVSILVEGTDVPYATTAILLRKTQSLSLYLQAVGRVLRPHPDKDKAIILDCVGVIEEHGLPHWDIPWSLSPPARKAKRMKDDDDEPDVLVKKCPKCKRYHEPGEKKNDQGHEMCPHCDYVYPIKERREMEQVDGGLRLIDQSEDERLRRQKRALQGQAKTVDQLIAQGMGRVRAMKIVSAREKTDALRNAVIDNLEAARKRSGLTCKEEFGVTLTEVGRMKPKDLKALMERTAQPLVVGEAANDNQPSGGLFGAA